MVFKNVDDSDKDFNEIWDDFRGRYGKDITDFPSQTSLRKFLEDRGDKAANLLAKPDSKFWKNIEKVQKAMDVETAKVEAEKKTGRGSWMDVKKEVLETGKPTELRHNDRYIVRVIKRGKNASTVVDDMQTGRRLKIGSRRERDVLLSML